MSGTYTHQFDTPSYKGSSTINTGLFIGGQWVDPVEGGKIDVINPSTGKVITSVAGGTKADIDIAVDIARKAYKTSWGLKCPGSERGKLLNKLADLLEKHADEFTALEVLDVGKANRCCVSDFLKRYHATWKIYAFAKHVDIDHSIRTLRYYAGWADKVQGKTIETKETKFAYTRHEPYGVVGQIIPWNYPLLMLTWKIGPALATGNTIVLKPSEITPLSALRICDLINEAGFPPGVVNIVTGYGNTAGQAISEHPLIEKVAFTGSTLTGRKILKAAAETNLKVVSLELGGKSPTVIFDDAEIEQAVQWASNGIFFNMGQSCIAGTRIFVQEGVYDTFMAKFTALAQGLSDNIGDPFSPETRHGPQVSQTQFERVMGYIESGKKDGAKVHLGGESHGGDGFFIKPTIFTECDPKMKITREEIFGPVACVFKFKTEEEVIELANDTVYGLACHIFTQNLSRAIRVAHSLEAGTAWVNCAQDVEPAVPFGGYKQSGIGKEQGEYALETYTQVKAVHINLGPN